MDNEDLEQEAERILDVFRRSNPGASDGVVALEALGAYHSCCLPPPKWATDALRECWMIYKEGHGFTSWANEHGQTFTDIKAYKTFDEVLGLNCDNIGTKNRILNENAKARKVHALFKQKIENGTAKDQENILWDEIAKELNVSSGAVAAKLYYGICLKNLGMEPVKGRRRPRK